MAESAEEAIKKEKRQKVDGVWIDKDYIEPTNQNIIKIIEDMPKTFPNRESDEYDLGYQKALTDLIEKIKLND